MQVCFNFAPQNPVKMPVFAGLGVQNPVKMQFLSNLDNQNPVNMQVFAGLGVQIPAKMQLSPTTSYEKSGFYPQNPENMKVPAIWSPVKMKAFAGLGVQNSRKLQVIAFLPPQTLSRCPQTLSRCRVLQVWVLHTLQCGPRKP